MNMVTADMAMPPIEGMAIGCITSEPRPSARKTGMRPITVVAVVNRSKPWYERGLNTGC